MKGAENDLKTIDRLIALYVKGEIGGDDFKRLRQWCDASSENRRHARERIEAWLSANDDAATKTSFDKQRAYNDFLQRIAQHEKPVTRSSHRRKMWLSLAAVMLLLLLPFAGYWKGATDVKRDFGDITIEAPLGSSICMSLPDSTRVWLNAGSKLIYSQGFGLNSRDVELRGEGYFEVKKNSKLPFIVHTEELAAQVLGTKFSVKSYEEDENAAVDVLDGSVAVSNKLLQQIQITLQKGERVVLTKSTGEMKKMLQQNAEAVNAWSRNELFFDEMPLKDIAKQLSRSFGTQIIVADSLQNRCFYGDFKVVGNTVEDILNTLSKTGRMRYRYAEGRYVIY